MKTSQTHMLLDHWQYLASTPDKERDLSLRKEAALSVLSACKESAGRRIRGVQDTRGKDAEDLASDAFLTIWRRMEESATGHGTPLCQNSIGAIKVYISRCVGNAMRPRSGHIGVDTFLFRVPESELANFAVRTPDVEGLAELAMQVEYVRRLLLENTDNEHLWRWFQYALRIRTGAMTWRHVVVEERGVVRGNDSDKERDWFDTNLRRRRDRILRALEEMDHLSGEIRRTVVNLVDHVMRLREAPDEQED